MPETRTLKICGPKHAGLRPDDTATKMKIVLVLGCLVACTSSAGAEDRILGLLALPEVFGNGPCDRFSPQEVPLHAIPNGAAVGVVHVVKYWTFDELNGGCEGLQVAVRLQRSAVDQPLPTEEYEYEAPAAIVLEQRGRWFRLRLASGAAWVLASPRDEFRSLETLFEGSMTFLTSDWSRQLADNPSTRSRTTHVPANGEEPSVRVLKSARVRGQLWFQIEVMSHSICNDPSEPKVIDRGWVAAHSRSGQPAIWFFSRGC